MKILKKLLIVSLFISGTFAFADIDYGKIDSSLSEKMDEGMENFADELGFSIPQAAVQQNVYPEAFIGNLYPDIPHFAVGFNAGFTHINTEGFSNVAEEIGISGVRESYYFPVFNADLRLGGFFLPFDFGFSFMKLDISNFDSMDADFSADFLTLAVDVRYAILKDEGFKPAISFGLGYSHKKGSFGAQKEETAEVGVDYKVNTLYGQVQISKTLNIPNVRIGFTPFVGIRGVLTKYSNDWSWGFKGEGLEAIKNAASTSEIKASGSGNASGGFSEFDQIQPQLYGGLGINLVVIQITASICGDLRHLTDDMNLWSGAVSLRLKI